jgi:alpha-galactosidase
MSVADSMAESGMVAAGYTLALLDDCWSAENRSANGSLIPDPSRFPSGIPALVAYLEQRGMTLGLYTCAGTYTCKWNRPGSLDHWTQDANTLASWGVKYVKMDWCNHGPLPPWVYYGNMSAAINATGTEMWFATCDWGEGLPWTGWGAQVAQSFRVGPDHLPFWNFTAGGGGGQGTANIIQLMAQVGNFTQKYGWCVCLQRGPRTCVDKRSAGCAPARLLWCLSCRCRARRREAPTLVAAHACQTTAELTSASDLNRHPPMLLFPPGTTTTLCTR